MEAKKLYSGMTPYRFSFTASTNINLSRHRWIRFYRDDMEAAFSDCKRVALREYPDAHNFLIESDQDDEGIRKSWGLPR